MSAKNVHIIFKQLLVLLCLSVSVVTYAQLEVSVGDTSTLAVNGLTGVNYEWEIYDQNPTDFATTSGNATPSKATFVSGNTGASVQVKWLEEGTYFYKVVATDNCSDNLKVGIVNVTKNIVTKPPKPAINVVYDCINQTATLTASDYTGTLSWSTNESADVITVNSGGAYTLYQTVNGVDSDKVEVFIQNPKLTSPDISGNVTTVYIDEEVTLSALGCDNGEIFWFSDKELTKEVKDITFNLTRDATFYAVCVTDAGCESEASELTLIVKYKEDDCDDIFKGLEGQITNAISPNGNGENDVWKLTKLFEYCEKCNKTANIEIFNRWGNTVYKQRDYFASSNKFNGQTHNTRAVFEENEKLPDGTYFYVIKTEGNKSLTGWIYVGR